VQLRVNYCLLDSDQIFIGFVLKQFEFIEGGQIPYVYFSHFFTAWYLFLIIHKYLLSLNFVVEWLALLLCIQEVSGSNLGLETGYSD
jgi:hypothetical protein